jgi:hypothetical protein
MPKHSIGADAPAAGESGTVVKVSVPPVFVAVALTVGLDPRPETSKLETLRSDIDAEKVTVIVLPETSRVAMYPIHTSVFRIVVDATPTTFA